MSLSQNIKNGLLSADSLRQVKTNAPTQYADRQYQYFGDESSVFVEQYAKYSSDFYEAYAQGLREGRPYEWEKVHIRLSDVISSSASIKRYFDDNKEILIAERGIDYVRRGTKFKVAGSTWLAVNPANMSGGGNCIIRRCNAVWNTFDYYGNVISEPLCIDKLMAAANDSDTQQSLPVAKGYFNLICQYNPLTAQLDTNSRMILGTGAYRVTGYTDFQQEFTGDYNSVRVLEFTIRYEEPNYAIDDMENHVAGGKEFSWRIGITGNPTMIAGQTGVLIPTSERNGKTVISTEDKPISYIWSSSDPAIATVDGNGNVTAVAEGECVISVALEQNPDIKTDYALSVLASETTEDGVHFTSPLPEKISAYTTVTLTASYFEDGEETEQPISWEVVNANGNITTAQTAEGNGIEIKCWRGQVTPVTITAVYGDYSASHNMYLEGI